MSDISAVELFQKLLNENNLTAQLTQPKVRSLHDGAILIEQPQLQVTFTNPPVQTKEEPKKDEPTQPSAEEVASQTPETNG